MTTEIRLFPLALVTLTVLLAAPLALAQNTTSAIRVEVADTEGSAVGDLAVTITHIPTGRTQALVTNEQGVIVARGLAVGGPYVVAVPEGGEYATDKVEDIHLELEETQIIALTVRPASFEEITVTAQLVGEDLTLGVGRDFGPETIQAVPSISRDFVSTLATEPKILVDNSVARGPAVSMAGQNFRFNSVTIDGVAQNDNFGLSKNASATQRTPISIDALEAINVNIAPFDVTYGNFVGGNINIVTKSGTNDFQGSVVAVTTDDGLTGNSSEDVDDLGIGTFEEETYGASLGGPIVRDKLFFFANYETFETTVPSNSQIIDNIAGVDQADVDEAISIFNTVYGFDPGTFDASDVDEDEKVLLKLAWNVNDHHRAVASYQVAEGDVLFDDFPEVAVLQSNRYNINEKLTAFSAQLFSSWNDRFTTELKFGTKDVENRQVSVDTTNPDFAVTAPGGGTITAGGDRFRHGNELDNDSELIRIRADYQAGNHLLTFGFEREEYTARNLFVPFSKGQWNFFSLDDLRNRNLGFALYGNSNNGIQRDAEANFSPAVNSLYLQDEWTAGDDLTFKLGLRYDEYDNSDEIPFNHFFFERNGFSNQENLDGKDLLLPRLGFSWSATDDITIRGGAGLFGGGTPLIMLGNSYSGNGITRTIASFFAPSFGPPVSDALANAVAALPDPTAGFTYLQQFIGVNPDSDVDAIDPNFEPLSTWKYSLGGDFRFGKDWLLGAEVIFSDVKDGFDIYEGRRVQVATAPDGRPIYDFPAGGDYIVTNTGEGKGTVVTLSLDKSFTDTPSGRWDLNLGYTNQDVEELRSYNRFIGYESYAFDPHTDLNNGQVADSRYEVEDRITATVLWQKQVFGDNTTSIGLTYQGRSGRHFSWVFGSGGSSAFGGTFLADFGSEGDNPGSQLFYVPTGPNDSIITGDPGFLADLDQFISGEPCLDGSRGSVVPRNNCETGWVNIFSIRLQQEIRAWGDTSFDLFLDVENLGNLINSDWGRIDSYTAPSNVAPAIVSISGDGSQYVLTPNAAYAGTPETIVADPAIARLPSVHRIQLGARFSF
ncbi:MAG: TonB-dependent receptor [bacterium]|nr:TonB-dependent receptor [bacterium]